MGVFPHRCGANAAQVRAGPRLGQAEAAEDLAEGQGHEPLFLLRFVAEGEQRGAGQPEVCRDCEPGRSTTAPELLKQEGRGQAVAARAAIGFRDVETEVSERRHGADGIPRERAALIDFPCARRDLPIHKSSQGILQQPVLIVKLEVHPSSLSHAAFRIASTAPGFSNEVTSPGSCPR